MEMNRLGYLLWGVVALGCGGATAKTASTQGETSTVSGALSVASFPAAPTAIHAVDETGASAEARVDSAGRFQLALAKGHTYRFTVALASSSEPIVFPRASNRLDMTVRISAGSATIDLGSIRHFDAAPASGFKVKSSSATTSSNENEDDEADGECVDGKDAKSGAVCVDDDDKHGCGENGHDDHGGDGECENGKDAKTGAACTDEDDADDDAADPTKPMAVPEHNAPDEVASCTGDGDGEKEDGEKDDGETNDD